MQHCGSITAMNGRQLLASQRRMEAEAESDTIAGHGCTNSSSCRMMPCYLAQEDDAIMPKSINKKERDQDRDRGHLVENRKQKSGCCCCCDIATNTAASISTSSTTSTLVTRGRKKKRFQCNTCKAILPSTHMKQCARCTRVTCKSLKG